MAGWGEPAAVLDEIAEWTRKAVAEGADLVLFPELVIHGHCTPNTYELGRGRARRTEHRTALSTRRRAQGRAVRRAQ